MGSAEAQAGYKAEARASGCAKQAALRIIEGLPDDASLEDVMDALCFRQQKALCFRQQKEESDETAADSSDSRG